MKGLVKKHKKWLGIGAAFILIIAVYYIVSSNIAKGKKPNAVPPVAVSVVPVMLKDMKLVLRDVGTVTVDQSVGLRARIDSQIMEVKFKDGDYVRKGDILFILDDRALTAQRDEMKANVARDKAQLENLRLQYQRLQGLAAKGYVSKADLDNARAAYEAQRASVVATEASLENITAQLEYTRITAPISGRTGTISVTVGNTVKANDTGVLVTINQTQPILVQMTLPQAYFDKVRDAMEEGKVAVTASREGNKETSTGTLSYIDNMVNQSSGTFVTRAIFPNEDELLWPGMFVTVAITLGEEKQVPVIPEVAVQHGQSEDYVFVIADNKAHLRPVKVSRLQEGLAVISEGLKEGEQVATDGMMSLKEGSVVNVKGGNGVM
jgi:membrane fusion protein, multidrug efflux system